MRRRAGAIVAALVLGALISVIAPSSVHAAAGGPMTAQGGAFQGTSGDDLLVLARDADLLTHNRFAAGDPGFASATDFDSTVEGVQSIPVGTDKIQFGLGEGDDTVRVVGQMPNPLVTSLTSTDYGAGTDTLDVGNFSGVSGHDGFSVTDGPSLERFIGTAYNDYFYPGYYSRPVPALTVLAGAGDDVIFGGPLDDTLDGGSGNNEIHAGAGTNTIAVDAPFPAARRAIDTFGGQDTVVFRGTASADDLALVIIPSEGGPQRVIADAAHPDGGYVFGSEVVAARVELGDGNDSLLLDAITPTVVDGGNGADDVVINAHEATAAVAQDNDDTVVTLPAFLYFADGAPAQLRLKNTASLKVVDETLIATAPGPGGGPHIRTFRADGTPVAGFFAYTPTFTGGVSVALGDLDGDFDDEIITGAGPGGGPHVRVFRSDGTDSGVGFFAYDPNFHGGVTVAAVDLDGDDVDEIVTVPALGGGPHVRIWSGDGELLDEFMAEGFGTTGLRAAAGSTLTEAGRQLLLSAVSGASLVASLGGTSPDLVPYPGFGGGAAVAGAEIDAGPPRGRNGYHNEIVTAAGPGGGPHVKVFESSLSSDSDEYSVLTSFYAYDPNFHGGVDVATCNPDGLDDEIVTSPGAGGGPHVRMFSGKTGVPLALSFMAYDPNFHGGVRVACGGAESKAY